MSQSQDNPTGQPFGRYQIRKRLARGGMGEVFLADQLGPQGPVRPVALKRMLPGLTGDSAASTMFLEEMATAAQLTHPNIATTYDFGEVDGTYFIAMEYLEGLTLRDLLSALGPLPVGAALSIVRDVAGALSFAHQRRDSSGTSDPVVHRDVSPQNIMISTQGAVKLLDFGIARTEAFVMAGRMEGKVAYAPPEQLRAKNVDRRSDLWSLGVVLYEALSGIRPFEETDPYLVLEREEASAFAPIDERRPEAAPLGSFIQRALEPSPDRRWQHARDVVGQIDSLEIGLATAAQLAELVAQAGGPRTAVDGVETAFKKPAVSLTQTLAVSATTGSQDLRAALPRRWPAAVLSAAIAASAAAWLWPRAPEVEILAPPKVALPPTTESPAKPPATALDAAPASATARPEATAKPPEAAPAAQPTTEAPRKKPKTRKKKPRKTRKRVPTAAPASTSPASGDSRGRTERLEAKVPIGEFGFVSVRTVPWGRATIDGRPLGTTPIVDRREKAGHHQLVLKAGTGDHAPVRVPIEVQAGKVTKVIVDFGTGKVHIR